MVDFMSKYCVGTSTNFKVLGVKRVDFQSYTSRYKNPAPNHYTRGDNRIRKK